MLKRLTRRGPCDIAKFLLAGQITGRKPIHRRQVRIWALEDIAVIGERRRAIVYGADPPFLTGRKACVAGEQTERTLGIVDTSLSDGP